MKLLKKLAKYGAATTALVLTSTASFAAGIGDIAGQVQMDEGKAAVIATGVALGGFLVVGLAVRYILGFFKRV